MNPFLEISIGLLYAILIILIRVIIKTKHKENVASDIAFIKDLIQLALIFSLIATVFNFIFYSRNIYKSHIMNFYFTCSQLHRHTLPNGNIWDKDGAIKVTASSMEEAQDWMLSQFGAQWGHSYFTYLEIKAHTPKGIVGEFNLKQTPDTYHFNN